jgi:hypothetical protein
LIILDLNNTLVARRVATSKGAKNATPRPYLSSFLEYLCGSEIVEGQRERRFSVMVSESSSVLACLNRHVNLTGPRLADLVFSPIRSSEQYGREPLTSQQRRSPSPSPR